MSRIAFKRIAPDESRILQDGEHVGDVYAHDDILQADHRYFVIHLDEDPRGPHRVHERHRVREVAQQLVNSHPLWP